MAHFVFNVFRVNTKCSFFRFFLYRLYMEFPYLTSGSRCIIGKNAPHVRKTAMAIIFTAITYLTLPPMSKTKKNSFFFGQGCQRVSHLKRHTLSSRKFLQPLTCNRTILLQKFSPLSTKRTSSYISSSRR